MNESVKIERPPEQREASIESILENGEISSTKELEGYWGMHLVDFKDGGDAFFRPDKETDFLFESTSRKSRRSDLEIVASKVDQVLEFGLVPSVVRRTINGMEGSLQKRINDACIARLLKWTEVVKPEEITRAAIFDYLLDVKDRRGDNFLVDSEKGKIWLIDHDYFMFWNEIFRSDILQQAQTLGLNRVTGEIQAALERFLANVDLLTADAKPEVIEILKKARDRAEALLDEGQLPPIDI